MRSIVTIADDGPNHCFATWRNLAIIIWRRTTTGAAVRTLSEIARSMEQAYRSVGVASMAVVEAQAELPPADIRRAIANVMHNFDPFIRCSAVVVEGEGFRPAAVRSIATGIALVARPSFPHKVFAKVDDCCTWLAPRLPRIAQQRVEARQLIDLISSVRGAEASGRFRETDILGRGSLYPEKRSVYPRHDASGHDASRHDG